MDGPTPPRPTPNATAAATGALGPALDPGRTDTGVLGPLAPLPRTEEGAGTTLNRALRTGHGHVLLEVSDAVREDANTLIIETCPLTK